MKRASLFLALMVAGVALITTSCGTSDYVKSLTLSSSGSSSGGFYNLSGVDSTIQLHVVANYNSGKTLDVTNAVTWTATPNSTGYIYSSADPNYLANGPLPAAGPNTVTISPTGLMTGIAAICTWVDLTDPTTSKPATPPIWAYTGYYQVTATYRNFTSQPIGIGMGIAESNSPTGGCGPA